MRGKLYRGHGLRRGLQVRQLDVRRKVGDGSYSRSSIGPNSVCTRRLRPPIGCHSPGGAGSYKNCVLSILRPRRAWLRNALGLPDADGPIGAG